MTTELEKLIELFHEKDWDWNKLSENPNITWYIVKQKYIIIFLL